MPAKHLGLPEYSMTLNLRLATLAPCLQKKYSRIIDPVFNQLSPDASYTKARAANQTIMNTIESFQEAPVNKRPFTKHPTLFLITPLLTLVLFVFVLLPHAMPTTASSATPTTNGVCTRFSLYQGRNAATGAGVAGRYEMREVTTGGLLASWEASGQATVSDWITDLPQVADSGSWVEVNFYPGGEETAVPLEILNPAPNTSYGWVANGQCHAIELQFPTDWQPVMNDDSGLGGSGAAHEQDTESVQQEWVSNLDTIRPILDTRFSNVPSFLEVSNLGAWADDEFNQTVYGFTLTNPSPNHFITDLQIGVSAFDVNGFSLFSCVENIRDIFPSEKANIGNVLCDQLDDNGNSLLETAEIEQLDIAILTANQLEISDEPESLIILPLDDIEAFYYFTEPPISVAQEEIIINGEESQVRDQDTLNIRMKLFNPNGSFIASNISVSIVAFDENGAILSQFQETFAEEILPRQSFWLIESLALQTPEQLHRVEANIDVEQFVPIDPKTITTSVIESVSYDEQNVLVEISPTNGLPLARIYHGTLPSDTGYGIAGIAIARDKSGETIGGGWAQPFSEGGPLKFLIPIHASEAPDNIGIYLNGEFFVVPCLCGGGGNIVGRDNFPIEISGARLAEGNE